MHDNMEGLVYAELQLDMSKKKKVRFHCTLADAYVMTSCIGLVTQTLRVQFPPRV